MRDADRFSLDVGRVSLICLNLLHLCVGSGPIDQPPRAAKVAVFSVSGYSAASELLLAIMEASDITGEVTIGLAYCHFH